VIQAIRYDSKPTNTHKRMKVCLLHTPYTCFIFLRNVIPVVRVELIYVESSQ